jgi:hypothetical protein
MQKKLPARLLYNSMSFLEGEGGLGIAGGLGNPPVEKQNSGGKDDKVNSC